MAEVYIAHDRRLERVVAVKVLMPDSARDPSFEERFRREAKVAAALNHPAIVGIYDTGEEVIGPRSQRVSYIVMEHVAGRTARELLEDGMSQDQALDIVTGLLSALDYSHRAGVVHRDIKPGNIMVTTTGAVKVMDFGIARALDSPASGLTQTWSIVGTVQYMSPEQASGEQVDARSDLYSAGCVLFELLTGEPLFTADSMVAVAYKHIAETPPVPSHLNPAVPAVLDQVVARALVKNRDARYQTAAQFRTEVEAVRRPNAPPRAPVPAPRAPTAPVQAPAAPATAALAAAAPATAGLAGGPVTYAVPGTVVPGQPVVFGTYPAGVAYMASPGYEPASAVEPPESLGWLIGIELVVAVVALAGIVLILLASG